MTGEEKRRIGTHSMPRPEIDLLAFRPCDNVVHVIECKSYLDNPGVSIKSFQQGISHGRFKIFNDDNRRKILLDALKRNLIEQKVCGKDVELKLGLVTGKIRRNDREALKQLFNEKNWILWDDKWLSEKLEKFSDGPYEDSVVDMIIKLIFRQMAGETKGE